MQIKLLFRLALALMPLSVAAQSSYIKTTSDDYRLIDRLEIKTRNPLLSQSFAKPYSRARVFAAIDSILNNKNKSALLTNADRFKLNELLNDAEYSKQKQHHFSFNKNGFESKTSNGYFIIDPVLRADISREKNSGNHPNIFTAGFDARGIAFKKVAFNFYVTDNQERLPVFLNNWLGRYNTVPGAGNFELKNGRKVNYWDVRGSLQTSVTKYIDLQIGYDKNFIGNGYRSLFLSDFSSSTAFAKLNARVWKLNFQSLYIQLQPQYGITKLSEYKKYLRINTLGIDATRWLNIAFFDAVVLGRKNGFDINYILPVTFLRAMEQQSGSPDNALFGMNVKANVAGKIQLYGQVLLDEFKLSEIKARSGWWANKYGYQVGLKYVDAFQVKNLDVQIETNRIRPFTYSHFDSVSNYSNYNQPLAHPLGANFHEFIAILHYQLINHLGTTIKAIYYTQGLDSLGINSGNNVLTDYNSRPRDYGWTVGSGNKATCFYFSALISYEIMKKMFVDVSFVKRNFKTQLTGDVNTTMISAGIRWNISRREFDY